MNQGIVKPNDIIPAKNEPSIETKTDSGSGKFHRPSMGFDRNKPTPSPSLMNEPLRAHKVGENNGDVVLRTEKESRIILIPEKELTVYKRTGQPTGVTIFLTVVIMILGALLVSIFT